MPIHQPAEVTRNAMQDGTRLIFWVDMLIVVAVMILMMAQQWDWMVALLVGLIVLNYFDRWRSRHP